MSRLGPQKISADQTTTPAATVPTDVTLLDSYTEATLPTELGAIAMATDGDGGVHVGDGSVARRLYQEGDNVYGVINVMDAPYNAVADNITDNSTAVQEAVDALPATGGTVYIPQDCLWTPASVTIAANVCIADHSGTGVRHYFQTASVHHLPTGIRIHGAVDILHVNDIVSQGARAQFSIPGPGQLHLTQNDQTGANGGFVLRLFPNLSTNEGGILELFSTDFDADRTNYERFQILPYYESPTYIRQDAGGTGTLRGMVFQSGVTTSFIVESDASLNVITGLKIGGKNIVFGANDSGGAGYRTVLIENA